MQLKHFEHLANLERSIVKEQFQQAVKNAPNLPFGPRMPKYRLKGKQAPREQKLGKANVPQVAKVTAQTGNWKEDHPNPTRKFPGYEINHISLGLGKFPGSRTYPKQPTEAEIRDRKGHLAALAANDGLTPGQGGALGLRDDHAAAWRPTGKPLYRPRLRTKTQVQ